MRSDCHCVIAIDGPAASGKSTVAREIARRLAFVYVNSGAMYRAITWYVLEKGCDDIAPERVVDLITRAKIRCDILGQAARIIIDELDPIGHLREALVNRHVSQVSAIPQVRSIVDGLIRECARDRELGIEW